MTTLLSLEQTTSLPSQTGMKGRPRKNGRVRVALTGDQYAEMANIGQSTAYRKVVSRLIPVVAAHFNIQPTDVTMYPRECSVDHVTFIVKGVDANSCLWLKQTEQETA